MNYNIELKWGGDSIIESTPQLIKIHYLFRSSAIFLLNALSSPRNRRTNLYTVVQGL
jgi:hypothetical protein